MINFQAIETKYLAPTNTRGARIKAAARAGSVTISYPHELNTDQAHAKAAWALVNKLGWVEVKRLHQGTLPNGNNCFVIQYD